EHICRKLRLKKGETLIDMGCGWGGFVMYAAEKYGVKTYGVTLSKEQVAYANEEINRRGLQDQVKFDFLDYRDAEGKYDKVLSIGMMEHVGVRDYDNFLAKYRSLMKDKGIGFLHTIGTFAPHVRTNTWMEKYIFPGGQLPLASEVMRSI